MKVIPELFLLVSLVSLAAGSYLCFGIGIALLASGIYTGIIALTLAYVRGQN